MKHIFFIKRQTGSDFFDPKNNIERLRRIRSLNLKELIEQEDRETDQLLSTRTRWTTYRSR